MAGLGRKLFTRATLSSADVQGYLMDQSVMVFASASARTAAVTGPTEGMVTYLKDVKRLEVYDGTGWRRVPRGSAGGLLPATTSSGGDVLIPHGLGAVPTRAWVLMGGIGNDAIYGKPAIASVDATNVAVRLFDTRTGAVLTSFASNFWWGADLL